MRSQQTDMAARVWQRVQEGSPSLQERQTLQNIIRQLRSEAGFLQKQGQQASPAQSLIKQLARELAEQEAVLRGIHTCSTGNPVGGLPRWQPIRSIKECYRNALERLKEYLLRSADPQFAPVYTQLAQQTREQCVRLMQVAGMEADIIQGGCK